MEVTINFNGSLLGATPEDFQERMGQAIQEAFLLRSPDILRRAKRLEARARLALNDAADLLQEMEPRG